MVESYRVAGNLLPRDVKRRPLIADTVALWLRSLSTQGRHRLTADPPFYSVV
jgi:hypothetical protein